MSLAWQTLMLFSQSEMVVSRLTAQGAPDDLWFRQPGRNSDEAWIIWKNDEKKKNLYQNEEICDTLK